jgi:hypothetical protein
MNVPTPFPSAKEEKQRKYAQTLNDKQTVVYHTTEEYLLVKGVKH